ncbi:hypothetical protein AC1031_018818 [Aphanomyces cochlioides]|nr:hypothetical protein AC1031_018818 [Aphanomyces cochlioides]
MSTWFVYHNNHICQVEMSLLVSMLDIRRLGEGGNEGGGLDKAEKEEEILTTAKVARNIAYLLVFVIILETLIHRLRHFLSHNKKYLELLNKTTAEFMIVGLVSLLIKFAVYVKAIEKDGLEYEALEAADTLLFFVAISLVVQSFVVILVLRYDNLGMDTLELVSTGELVVETKLVHASSWWWSPGRYWQRRRIHWRLLETLFRRVYDLPRLFSFAKYSRDLQEHQIVEILEIDLTTWLLLFCIFCGVFFSTGEMKSIADDPRNVAYYVVTKSEGMTKAEYNKLITMQDNRVVVLAILVSLLFLVMVIFLLYINWLLLLLVSRAKADVAEGVYDNDEPSDLESLELVAAAEAEEATMTSRNALAQMQAVGDALENNDESLHTKKWDSLLLQLVASGVRKLLGRSNIKRNRLSAKIDDVVLPGFYRKACEFLIQFLLIVNGLYVAMVFANIVPTLEPVEVPTTVFTIILLVVNMMILGPQLLGAFSLLNGIYRVEAVMLGNVISHFVEAEKEKGKIVADVRLYCKERGKTIDDIRTMLDSIDAINKDGYVDVELLRRVMSSNFGYKTSRHKFNAFVRMMEIETRDATVFFDDFVAIMQPKSDASRAV